MAQKLSYKEQLKIDCNTYQKNVFSIKKINEKIQELYDFNSNIKKNIADVKNTYSNSTNPEITAHLDELESALSENTQTISDLQTTVLQLDIENKTLEVIYNDSIFCKNTGVTAVEPVLSNQSVQ